MGLQGQPDVAALDAMAGDQFLVKVPGVEVPSVEQFENLRHLVRAGPARRDPAQATVVQPFRAFRLVAPALEGAFRNALRRLALAQHTRCDTSFLSPCRCSVRRHLLWFGSVLKPDRVHGPDISSVIDTHLMLSLTVPAWRSTLLG